MIEQAIVKAERVSKRFGSNTVLDNISFTIESGKIVGLIGPNGAGKTTLLKGILGLTQTNGDLQVLGLDPKKHRSQLMQNVSFIADTAIIPRWIKVHQVMDYMAGVHPLFDKSKAQRFLQATKIKSSSRVSELSKGMVTQLHLALIMSIDSKLLVLDEPTLGLDLLFRKQFYSNLLTDFYDEEKTILITTHQVEEVEHILTDVLFIGDGEIVLDSPVEELNQHYVKVFLPNNAADDFLHLGVKPLDEQPKLGGKNLILAKSDIPSSNFDLSMQSPSIAELFVAIMKNRQQGVVS